MIARALGWPEARQAVAPRLKLTVRAARDFSGTPHSDVWAWRLTDGETRIDGGITTSQPGALALGLAALDTASVRTR